MDAESIDRFLTMVDDPYNCLTLCSGSLNANPNNNVAAIVRKHCDRIPFAHVRNIHHFENGDFSEAAHRDFCGDTGIIEILRTYHDCGFDGCIRPDHGRRCERRPWQLPPRLRHRAPRRTVYAGRLGPAGSPRRREEQIIFAILKLLYKTKSRCPKSSGFLFVHCIALILPH